MANRNLQSSEEQLQAARALQMKPIQKIPSGQESLNVVKGQMASAQSTQMARIKKSDEKIQALQLQKQQRQTQRRIQRQKSQVGSPTEQISSTIGQQITAQLLKASWLNIIDSFGTTLLYINFHFLGKYFAGSKAFCDFGQEWAPKGMPGA